MRFIVTSKNYIDEEIDKYNLHEAKKCNVYQSRNSFCQKQIYFYTHNLQLQQKQANLLLLENSMSINTKLRPVVKD